MSDSRSTGQDKVRERLAEIRAVAKREFDFGGRYLDRSSTERGEALLDSLVAALTAVLDDFDYYAQYGTEDEQDVIQSIRRRLAAALGVTE